MGTVFASTARRARHSAPAGSRRRPPAPPGSRRRPPAPPGSRRRPAALAATWLGAAVALIAAAAPHALAQTGPTGAPEGITKEAAAPPDSPFASPDVVAARGAFQEGTSRANEDRWADALQA